METYQKFKLNIKNFNEEENIKAFICQNNKQFYKEGFTTTNNCIEYKADEANLLLDDLETLVLKLVKEYPNISISLKGQQDTTDDSIMYEYNYNNRTLIVLTSDYFYERYPEDYDEYIGFCEEFNINDIISDEEWDEVDDGEVWFFIDGDYATKDRIKLNNKKEIKI